MDMGIPGVSTGQSQASQSQSNSDAKKKDDLSLIDEIRQKGFMAYVQEIHAKKIEELRARILDSMGLSEDELRKMPADQRNTIEDMIAEKIKRSMMTESAMNGGNGSIDPLADNSAGNNSQAMNGAMANSPTLASSNPSGQGASGNGVSGNRFDIGFAVLQAVQNDGSAPSAVKDDPEA